MRTHQRRVDKDNIAYASEDYKEDIMVIVIEKRIAKKIDKIFEHPGEVYSIYFKDGRDVVWVEGKTALYQYILLLKKEP